MRLVSRLSGRVVLVAVVSGLVGVLVALVAARSGVRRGLALAVREQYDGDAARACEAAPERFSLGGPGHARTFAYDLATSRSPNPDAPSIDRDLARKLANARDGIVWSDRLAGGGTILLRAAGAGPCSVLQMTWRGNIASNEGVGVATSAAALTVAMAALLGLLLVVRPLVRRTAALEGAASRLGVASGHDAQAPVAGDELDLVLAKLIAADARIRSDGARLEQRSRALERHLGDVAHDVRTPLSAMQLLIEQAADTDDRAAARELLGAALGECVYLSGLTENLRLRSLLEDGWTPRVPTDPVDVRAVVERICARATPLARRRGIVVDYATPDEPVTVLCDPLALERALTNVVENAVAHGERGGHVAVTLTGTSGAFVAQVLDDGPGVSPEDLPRLAERAFSADAARSRDLKSSGLGLAITAELCARSGIDLAFARLEPRGLRVTLSAAAQ